MSQDTNNQNQLDNGLGLDYENEIKEPKLFKVILHNDHYTTMEFVIQVLVTIFHKPASEATQIMLDVHKKGKGICGVYPYDVAATKVAQVEHLAKQNNFPLKCTYEEY